MPHAPLLLPEVAGDEQAAAVVAAVAAIDLGKPDVTVIASPHGPSTGVYERAAGDLDAFGPRGIDASAPTDAAFAAALAQLWGKPLLDTPADHGIVVPLRLLAVPSAVVAVAFAEGAGPEEGRSFARALSAVAGDRPVAFVASANTSAGLTDRAPLPSLDGAAAADEAVLRALRERPGDLVDNLDALARAGSCAAAPLA
ncbi:MAG: hypothetical protein M3279_12225, partial [Actinomycetota bacterium]|nr:hypothetical protein [Actinomycetota bacterium]